MAPADKNRNTTPMQKKNFCFATIPLVIISLLSLYAIISDCYDYSSNPNQLLGADDYMLMLIPVFIFIGSVVLSVLLFAKIRNPWLGVPMFVFWVTFLLFSALQIVSAYNLTRGEEIIFDTFGEALWDSLPEILAMISACVAFLIITVYTFTVTSMKKPAPKVLWIIPAVLFLFFYTPCIIFFLIYFIEFFCYFQFEAFSYMSGCFIYLLFPVAVILFIIWISFPYKKNKTAS